MANAESVTINTGDESAKGPSVEDQYKALVEEGLIVPEGEAPGDTNAQGGADEASTDSNDERPSWLPAKFKTVEDFVKSHQELERKLGAGETSEEDGDDEGDEAPSGPTEEERAAAEEATKKAGLDLKEVSVEWRDNGGLSEETYSKLEAAGYPKEMVDIYIEGLTARTNSTVNEAYAIVGDKSGYDAMIDWAIANLDAAEQDAFDKAVSSNNKATALMAIRGLKARMDATIAKDASEEPEEQVGKGGQSNANVYQTMDDYMEDLNDPRYDTNESFRRQVMAKLSRSKL